MVHSIRISDDLGSEDPAFEVGLRLFNERQFKDVQDVSAGRESARNLFTIQNGDWEGYTFTPNRAAEFDKMGSRW